MRTTRKAALLGAVVAVLHGVAAARPGEAEPGKRWYELVIATVDTGVELADHGAWGELAFPGLTAQGEAWTQASLTLFDRVGDGTELAVLLDTLSFARGEVPAVAFDEDRVRGWDGLRIQVWGSGKRATAVVFDRWAFRDYFDAPEALRAAAGDGIEPRIQRNSIILHCPNNASDGCCVTVDLPNGRTTRTPVPRDAYYTASLFTTAGVTMNKREEGDTCETKGSR